MSARSQDLLPARVPAAPALPVRRRRRPAAIIAGCLVAVVTIAVIALVYSRDCYPPLPGKLTLELTFPDAAIGETEPLLVTGMYGEGDLLVVRYLSEGTVVFAYDHWGAGGPSSEPVTFRPGSRHVLRVEMPSFTTYHKPAPGTRGWLRVDFDGQPVLHREVPYHGRQLKQVFFGQNAIGASASAVFSGTIRTSDGRKPSGGPETYFTPLERVGVWLRTERWQSVGALIAGVLGGLAGAWFAASRWPLAAVAAGARGATALIRVGQRVLHPEPPTMDTAEARRRAHRWFAGATLVAATCYAAVVTGGTFTFNYAEVFGSFYDYQAQSFLEGRLDVPEVAIGGEAFEARGKLYGYFGPTPALLRLPFVASGLAFGKLSRAFMVLYFVACLGAAYLIFRDALHDAAQGRTDTRVSTTPTPVAICVLVGSVGLGSTILFLGSRGLIFHEAILAGITFALWSCWCSLQYQNHGGCWWIGALICGVLALHSRPPTGLFALTLLGWIAVCRGWAAWRSGRTVTVLRTPALIAVLCALGFGSLHGLAWLKFRTFDPAPLRISRPYSDPARLAHIDGKSFHLVNIPYNVDTYFLRPNFRFEGTFPWFYLVSNKPRRDFPKAKIDLPDHTLALPYAMPSLFTLATLGCLAAFIFRPGTRAPVSVLWVAVLPMTLALLAAVATAQRYTGDFVPFLVAAGAFGLAAVETAPFLWRLPLRVLLVLLTLAALAANTAMTLYYQGEILWGVPEEIRQNFQRLRQVADAWFSS